MGSGNALRCHRRRKAAKPRRRPLPPPPWPLPRLPLPPLPLPPSLPLPQPLCCFSAVALSPSLVSRPGPRRRAPSRAPARPSRAAALARLSLASACSAAALVSAAAAGAAAQSLALPGPAAAARAASLAQKPQKWTAAPPRPGSEAADTSEAEPRLRAGRVASRRRGRRRRCPCRPDARRARLERAASGGRLLPLRLPHRIILLVAHGGDHGEVRLLQIPAQAPSGRRLLLR